MKLKLVLAALLMSFVVKAQQTTQDNQLDSLRVVNQVLNKQKNKLTIGGYAQIDYNEPDGSATGKLDVHRLVLLFGYNFTDQISFVTEIEYEHVKEVYVEQAFLNYNINPNFNVKGGLMLVPMGIVNEYHEPPTYYGVERPDVDKYIVPTTWRELGVGVSGKFDNLSLKYQAYLFNGFVSYKDGQGTLRGVDGLRKGRQKGAESMINSPNLSVKFDYYGILGLKLGLSGYFGNTQTDEPNLEDSTVGVSMVGLDARYNWGNLDLRGQYIFTSLSGTEAYNALTGNDLGSELQGYYAEAAYNIMPWLNSRTSQQLAVFGRYENYDTHHATAGSLDRNAAFDRTDITLGVDYKLTPGVALKMDYQFRENALKGSNPNNQFNAGIGIMF